MPDPVPAKDHAPDPEPALVDAPDPAPVKDQEPDPVPAPGAACSRSHNAISGPYPFARPVMVTVIDVVPVPVPVKPVVVHDAPPESAPIGASTYTREVCVGPVQPAFVVAGEVIAVPASDGNAAHDVTCGPVAAAGCVENVPDPDSTPEPPVVSFAATHGISDRSAASAQDFPAAGRHASAIAHHELTVVTVNAGALSPDCMTRP